MPYPIHQRAHQFNSIQSVPVSFGLWDTALKFLSPGPRSDVTDHLEKRIEHKENNTKYRKMTRKPRSHVRILTCRTWAVPDCPSCNKKSGIQDRSQNAGTCESEENNNFLILPIFAEQTNLVTTPTPSQVKTSVDKTYRPKSIKNGQINHNDDGCEKGDLANAIQ